MNRYIPCPCGSKLLYPKCCKKYHDGDVPATAEILMRSRYSAYAMAVPDYVIATTDPENQSYKSNTDEWRAEILQFCQATSFDGLNVLQFEESDDRAFVTFRATLKQGLSDASFTERSEFRKRDGKWFYRGGEIN